MLAGKTIRQRTTTTADITPLSLNSRAEQCDAFIPTDPFQFAIRNAIASVYPDLSRSTNLNIVTRSLHLTGELNVGRTSMPHGFEYLKKGRLSFFPFFFFVVCFFSSLSLSLLECPRRNTLQRQHSSLIGLLTRPKPSKANPSRTMINTAMLANRRWCHQGACMCTLSVGIA